MNSKIICVSHTRYDDEDNVDLDNKLFYTDKIENSTNPNDA